MTTAQGSHPPLGFNGKNILLYVRRAPEIKAELGGKWNPKEGAWELAPISLNVLRCVELFGDSLLDGADEDIAALAHEPWGFFGFSDEERACAEEHPTWAQAFEHQREGIEYAYCNPHGATLTLLSWGMGKGLVSVVTADLKDDERVLVLAPVTLALTWADEWRRWSDRSRDLKRATAKDRAPGPGVTIANHEVIQEVVLRDEQRRIIQPDWATDARRVREWINEGPTRLDARSRKQVPVRERIIRVRRDYLEQDWDRIIVDESVLLKNRRAVKVDVLKQLRQRCDPEMMFLSGSPTTKYRDDLQPQLRVMYPRGFRSYWRFAEFFCIVDKDGWGWTIEGDRSDRDPHHYLRDFIWVNNGSGDLPEYIIRHMTIEALPRQRRALDTMLDEWIVELEEDPDARVVADNWLSRLTRLQQLTSNLGTLPKPAGGFYPRESAKLDLLTTLLKQGEIETPLLVWTWFTETSDAVIEELSKRPYRLRVGGVTGAQSREHKDGMIGAYKDGHLDALILQLNVGKFGHTFTHTRTIYYHDRAFDSDAWIQSLHRVRRIGLRHRPVLIVPKINISADELIDANLEGKLESMARLTQGDLAAILRTVAASCAA